MSQVSLTFNITSYWHIGSGEEGGSYADALALKDANGLPYLPGKSIKGLYRDAFEKAVNAGWFEKGITELLFGEEGKEGKRVEGVIQFASASLSQQEQHFFNSVDGREGKKQLYRVIQSTKIDSETGIATEGSFRAVEVVIPMALNTSVALNPNHPSFAKAQALLSNDFAKAMAQVASLIAGLGAKRQRGYGEVTISVVADKEA